MAIIKKDQPVGVEVLINRLQSLMYSNLCLDWGIDPDSDEYACYPKVYRNQTSDRGYTAEWFDGVDYKEVYFDDTKKAISFFGVSQSNNITSDNLTVTNIHIVFFVNLNYIKPLPAGFRNDEAARLDVQSILSSYGAAMGFSLFRSGTGIEYCLSEYPGSRKDEGLKFRDQHPIHCFRFDMTVWYNPTETTCAKTP